LNSVLCNEDITVVTYADDTYVLVSGKKEEGIISKTQDTIKRHIEYLKKMGMIVNLDKTEMMWIGKNQPRTTTTLSMNGQNIEFKKSIKALGITVSCDLDWSNHIQNVVKKGKTLMVGLKFLRKYLSEMQFLSTVVNSFYSTIFYASTVWYDCSKKSQLKSIDSMFYQLLRTACRDY